MAKSRKQQQVAKGVVAKAAEVVKETVVDVVKATTRTAESYVVEPVKKVLGLGNKKATKKRHVRPAKPVPVSEPAPLGRGKSSAAKTMSAGVAKGIVARSATETPDNSTPLTRNPIAASTKTNKRSRSNRHRAKRHMGES